MRLKSYIILAVGAFLIVAAWLLWPTAGVAKDQMPFYIAVFTALYVVAGLCIVVGFWYAIARLFWAVINRLER